VQPQTLDENTRRALVRLIPEGAPDLLRDFAILWLRMRRGRPMPTLADMDPLEMPWALDTVFVLRRREDGVFAYHLVGEGMTSRLGGPLKGKTAFDVFEPEYAAWTESRWQRAAAGPECCYVHTCHRTAEGIPLHAERLMMPLAGVGEGVDEMIGVTAFREWRREDAARGFDQTFRHTVWTPVAELPHAGVGGNG
jgi:hypothetical protein